MRLTWNLLWQQQKIFLLGWLLWGGVLYQRYDVSYPMGRGFALGGFLILIGVIDWRYGYIFDRMLLAMAVGGTGWSVVVFHKLAWQEILLSASLGSIILLALRYFSRGGMGEGDIKFMAALGFWVTWEESLLTLLLAFWAGSLAAVYLLCLRKKTLRDSIPFGPFLAGSAMAVLWGGDVIIQWYRSLL